MVTPCFFFLSLETPDFFLCGMHSIMSETLDFHPISEFWKIFLNVTCCPDLQLAMQDVLLLQILALSDSPFRVRQGGYLWHIHDYLQPFQWPRSECIAKCYSFRRKK